MNTSTTSVNGDDDAVWKAFTARRLRPEGFTTRSLLQQQPQGALGSPLSVAWPLDGWRSCVSGGRRRWAPENSWAAGRCVKLALTLDQRPETGSRHRINPTVNRLTRRCLPGPRNTRITTPALCCLAMNPFETTIASLWNPNLIISSRCHKSCL